MAAKKGITGGVSAKDQVTSRIEHDVGMVLAQLGTSGSVLSELGRQIEDALSMQVRAAPTELRAVSVALSSTATSAMITAMGVARLAERLAALASVGEVLD